MTIITRHTINKNIEYVDSFDHFAYSYIDVSRKVDLFKNFLLGIGAKRGESVLIGYGAGINQTALFLAICELGMSVIINDYTVLPYNKSIDTKSKVLMPIDYFFSLSGETHRKYEYFDRICNRIITQEEIEQYDDYKENDLILAEASDILIKCTSSGTTQTPKLIKHTHEFLFNISKRNSSMFYGNVGLMWNLNHGSSSATYFLPTLMSNDVTKVFSANSKLLECKETFYSLFGDVEHIMIPYANSLEKSIDDFSLPNLTYYTLGSISPKMVKAVKTNRCKDIISFFGCNETSGPIFVNKASYDDFSPEIYHAFDSYYEIENLNPLKVKLSEYSITINTNDNFEKIDDVKFKFNGRADLIKINGFPVCESYNQIYLPDDNNYSLVYDISYNRIYLALWGKLDLVLAKK